MNRRILKIFAIIILTVIIVIGLLQVFDFGHFIFNSVRTEKEMAKIDSNFNAQQLRFKNLDRLNEWFLTKDYNKAMHLIDSILILDSTRDDLLLKKGYVFYLTGNNSLAMRIFKKIQDRNLVIDSEAKSFVNKEIYYYALIGELIIQNKMDTAVFFEYQREKDVRWASLNIDTVKYCFVINFDSIIMEQIYY